jgi:hypothetical protein
MNDAIQKKDFDVRSLGIEETDSCPVCKRLLKSIVEENEGGAVVGRSGDWICLSCEVV